MFEGNLTEGELEIGQIASIIHSIQSVAEVMQEIITDYETARKTLLSLE